MELPTLLIVAVNKIGLTLGVGASTFALVFYINALLDRQIDPSERRFMHIVYVVLRIGMTLITLSLILFGIIAFLSQNTATLMSPTYLMEWTLIGVIIVNAILMTVHLMPMRFGPVLAGGSWYSLFLITVLPFADAAYQTILFFYGAFLVVFFIIFTLAKNYYTQP